MKILFLAHEFPPYIGGISVRVHRISKALSERGHEITVCTRSHPSAPRVEKVNGIKVERYNLLSSYIARFIKAPTIVMPGLFKLLGKKEIQETDIVHSFCFWMFVSLVAASLKLIRKKVFVLSPLFVPYYIKWSAIPYRLTLGNAIIRYADFLLPETSSERNNLVQFGVPTDRIQTIPDAINSDEYRQIPDSTIFRKKYGIGVDEKMVLFVGRPVLWKGIDHLVLAMQDVLKKIKKARLVVVGPYMRKPHVLLNLVSPDVRDRIIITGPVTEECKISAYSAADVFLMPSKLELFGIAILEAAAAGLPIVCTRTGVAPDIVIEGKNGLFVRYGKVSQISKAITKVLMNSNFKMEAERRRNHILKNYDVETEIDRYEKVYLQLTC
jgi:glycosyltransferase involved in cell wall biosynthesis